MKTVSFSSHLCFIREYRFAISARREAMRSAPRLKFLFNLSASLTIVSGVREQLLKVSAKPWIWIVLVVAFLSLNLLVGPYWEIPVLIAFPVVLATWHRGLRWGIPLAIILPVTRLVVFGLQGWPVAWPVAVLNCLNRTIIFVLLIYLVARVAEQSREMARKVKVLEGFLPICSFCKKIRDGGDGWHQLEQYITRNSEAQFSHGCCPTCMERHYGKEFAEHI
jgi:hypothetical protein